MDGGSSFCAFQVALVAKNLPANAGGVKRCRFDPWVWEIPWRKKWLPTPVFLSGESHGQRSLMGYSPWGHKELNMNEGQSMTALRVGRREKDFLCKLCLWKLSAT